MKKILILVLFVFVGGPVLSDSQLEAPPRGELHADLAFLFQCTDIASIRAERDVESFLREKGFRVLNQGRLQREHGVADAGLHLIGLDTDRRLVEFSSLPPLPALAGKYSVTLRSPPPTHHFVELETDLLTFVSEKLRCKTRQITHDENSSDAIQFYDWEIHRVEGLFHEAEQLQGQNGL
jgi:hypothetical protein